MKQSFLFFIGLITISAAIAQTKVAKPGTVKKPTTAVATKQIPAQAVVLANSLDSLSYAIGVLDASFFKQQGIEKLNYQVMMKAVQSVIEGKTPIMTPQMADQTLRAKLQEAAAKKVQPIIDEGLKFLAENKKRLEVKTTASGLQYEVLKQGDGAMPKDTNVVKVHYVGKLINGTQFDSSVDRGQPAEFPLNGVIPGWTEGVQLMNVGSKFKFYIPYQLAYGMQGSPPTIPGGSMLIFEVELLEVVK